MNHETTILWRRLDPPGHDWARLDSDGIGCRIDGTAVYAQERRSYRLDYTVVCDTSWRTRSARVRGWMGDDLLDLELTVDASGTWRRNGVECREVRDCVDIDLHFTPATNTLPIRRLDLAIGQDAVVHAAWLAPDLSVRPLEQRYRRTGPTSYRYESDGGRFTAALEVNEAGLVTLYSGLWTIETG